MNAYIKTAMRLVIPCIICGVMTGCGHNDDILIPGLNPEPIPDISDIYPLGVDYITISPNEETTVMEPFGSNGEAYVTLSYIATYPFDSCNRWDACQFMLEGHVGSMTVADFYNVFSVAEYNINHGLPEDVNSPEIEYEYEWIKVKCYKTAADNHTQLVISAEENTTGSYRGMYLYFTKPSLGTVDVIQPPTNPSESDEN